MEGAEAQQDPVTCVSWGVQSHSKWQITLMVWGFSPWADPSWQNIPILQMRKLRPRKGSGLEPNPENPRSLRLGWTLEAAGGGACLWLRDFAGSHDTLSTLLSYVHLFQPEPHIMTLKLDL